MGLTHKNNVTGCHQSAVATGHFQPRPRSNISEYSLLQCKKGGHQQAGLISSDTCLLSFVACLHVLAPRFLLVSWFPSLFCTESEDSSDLNSENLYQEGTACVSCASPSDPTYCTLSIQPCVSTSLANRASRTSPNRFFRGVMTPTLTPVRPGL